MDILSDCTCHPIVISMNIIIWYPLQEAALVRGNMDLVHLEKEKENLSAELSARRQELETTKQLVENQRAEERKLRKIIAEASAERTRQKKELEQVSLNNKRPGGLLVLDSTVLCYLALQYCE